MESSIQGFKSSPDDFNVLMRTTVLCPHFDPSGLCSAYLVSLFRVLSLSYQLFCGPENRTRTRVPCQNGGRDEIHRRVLGPCRTCLGLTPGSVQASHLLLLLCSFVIPSFMHLYSQHIISHFALVSFSRGHLRAGLFDSDQEPCLGTIPADHVDGTGCCPGRHPALASASGGHVPD